MFDVANSLQNGFDRAASAMREAQGAVARANAGSQSRTADAAMAGAARAAIFTQALLGAVHARLAELKAATK